jgi:sigma-B regulation protein RsbU (phosphoserine phosphatase)
MHFSIQRVVESIVGIRDDAFDVREAAERIQRSLLTVKIPVIEGVEIGVRASPARMVGGDYVELIARRDGSLIFAIGDASGKSLAAALKSMMLKYLIRGLTSVLGRDLAEIVRRANEVVCDDIEPDAFITFAIGTFDDGNRLLRIANAGHDPPLIVRAAGGAIEQLPEGRIVLGIDPEAAYAEQTAPLADGDTVVLYTDGFTEAQNPAGEQYTLARLKEMLRAHRELPPQALADALFDHVEAYSAGTLRDDATILIFRVTTAGAALADARAREAGL